MTLLLQIQDYMAAGHQLLGIRTSNALLLQLLSDSILPYDIQILLSCYKQGPGWLRSCLWQGWVLACKPSLYSSCKTCCCGFWGFCCYPAIMQLFLLKESIAFFFLFFFSRNSSQRSQPCSAASGSEFRGKKSEWDGGCGAPARDRLLASCLMLWLEIVLQVSLARGTGWKKADRPHLSWGKEFCN